jgi:hypothetical protein
MLFHCAAQLAVAHEHGPRVRTVERSTARSIERAFAGVSLPQN